MSRVDTSVMLRSAQQDRIGAHVRVFVPNEARNLQGLDSVAYGEKPTVEEQVVPLFPGASIPVPPAAALPSAAAVSAAAPQSYHDAVTASPAESESGFPKAAGGASLAH